MANITKKQLVAHLKEILKIDNIPPTISNQIHRFVTVQGYTYKDIARAVTFFIEVDGGTYEPKYGIGIVPYVHERAHKYYENMKAELEERQEQGLLLRNVYNQKKNEPKIKVKPTIKKKGTKKLIELD